MRTGIYILVLLSFMTGAKGQQVGKPVNALDPEATVRKLYELVSFEAMHTPDWESVRALFSEQASIYMRTSKEHSELLSLEGFLEDFRNFAANESVQKSGFAK